MNLPLRKAAPYIFYGQTTSLCEVCHGLVPAKIVIEGDDVYYLKRCERHGVQKTLVSTDAAYFRLCRDYIKPGDRPLQVQSRTEFGCPYDCGLCPDHEQHTCLALIDVNEACNLTCPVCFSDSSSPSEARIARSPRSTSCSTRWSRAKASPTSYRSPAASRPSTRRILDIIALAKAKPIRHIMLNTNGIRIAREPDFAAALAEFKPGFEVYLQFDSLQGRRAEDAPRRRPHRASGCRRWRRSSAHGISTTLVVVVKRGANEDEIGEIIDFALGWNCVRGITFQPIQDAGRNEGFDKNRDRVLLSDIRREIIAAGTALRRRRHHSRCPAIRNRSPSAMRSATGATSRRSPRSSRRTSWSTRCRTRSPSRNIPSCTGRSSSSSRSPPPSATRRSGSRRCSAACRKCRCRRVSATRTSFAWRSSNSSTPTISASGRVKRSCIHFLTPNGQIIPFDTYNLFYRNGRIDGIRRRLRQQSIAASADA